MLVTLRRTAIMWPMLLLPMASAALTTTGGSALAGKTVLGLRTVAEPRVVHSLRIPGQLWGWQVEIVVGRGRTEPRFVVGFRGFLGAYTSPSVMAAMGSLSGLGNSSAMEPSDR